MKRQRKIKSDRYRKRLYGYYIELAYALQSGERMFRKGYSLEKDLFTLFSQGDGAPRGSKLFLEFARRITPIH